MGKRVIPEPDVLAMIQDKGLQKKFYLDHDIATVPFYLANSKAEINTACLPFVQKLRTGGYDGKGVQVIKHQEDLDKLWDCPCVIEEVCAIDKEIAAIFVSDGGGTVKLYPLVEMVFDPVLNLVDLVQMPAQLDESIYQQANLLCQKLAQAINSAGIFAVEMFVSRRGEVWVNETACRVHNSGHVTIEACPNSQFEQMLRLLAGLPLGMTTSDCCAGMINLIGAEGESGRAEMKSLTQLMQEERVFLHWYGKDEVRAGRKMGHITLTADSLSDLKQRVERIKQNINLQITAEK